MGLFFTKRFYCCLLFFVAFAAKAQTSFTASASPSSAGKDEYITYTLTVVNAADIQRIQPPDINDFTVVGGPNQGSSVTMINGVTKQSVTLSYVLLAKKSGTFHINAATAFAGSKTYKSNGVDITVSGKKSSGNAQQPNNVSAFMQSMQGGFDPFEEPKEDEGYNDYILHKGDNIPEKVNRNMQLKLQTDKTSCYVGEAVLATYKLYTRLKSQSTLTKNPSFNGFSVVDLTQQSDPGAHTRESLNGRPYDVYIIRKAQLYPLQAGPAELETATLDNNIEFLKSAAADTYNPANTVTQNVSLSSKSLTINVKPLPEEGKPAGFKGAVGKFNIESSLQKNSFTTDEAGKLIVTITGKGNMQLLTAPDIKWPDGIEAFDTKCTDNTDRATIPVSGSKTFEVPFTVSKAGAYSSPEVSFSYFDPSSASYKTVTAPAISFSVAKGTGKPADYAIVKKEPVSLLNNIFEHRLIIILFVAGLIICGLIFWVSKENKAEKNAEPVIIEPVAEAPLIPAAFTEQNPLAQTEDCLHKEECVEFYALLNGEMRQFLSQKFGVTKELLTVKTLAAAMDKAGIDNHISIQTQQLLQDIEWQLYTPFQNDEQLHQMYAKAQTIVQLLNMRTI